MSASDGFLLGDEQDPTRWQLARSKPQLRAVEKRAA
jgi:hypothetical protein